MSGFVCNFNLTVIESSRNCDISKTITILCIVHWYHLMNEYIMSITIMSKNIQRYCNTIFDISVFNFRLTILSNNDRIIEKIYFYPVLTLPDKRKSLNTLSCDDTKRITNQKKKTQKTCMFRFGWLM